MLKNNRKVLSFSWSLTFIVGIISTFFAPLLAQTRKQFVLTADQIVKDYFQTISGKKRLNSIKSSVYFLLVFLALTSSPIAQHKPANKIDGRWLLTFDLPDSIYRTTVDFETEAQGNLKAEVLGEPWLTFKDSTIVENQIKINGKSPYGAVQIAAIIDDAKLTGKWNVGLIGGTLTGERESAKQLSTNRAKVFENVWQTINDDFYDPAFNGVDWRAMRAKYLPQVEKTRTDGEFLTVVRQMLKELKVSHVGFAYSPFSEEFTSKKISRETGKIVEPVSWKVLSPEVGYLRIADFAESREAVDAIDQAFVQIGNSPNLIVDLRGNSGGTLSIAMRLGDYLFSKQEVLGFFATRRGLKQYHAKSIDELEPSKVPTFSGYTVNDFKQALDKYGALSITTGGRARQPYRGRVVMLIDERCASTTEGLLGVIKERQTAILIGRKTAGGMLSSEKVKISGNWNLQYPKADYRTFQKVKIEGVGIEPDIVLDKQLSEGQVLKRAIDVLNVTP